MNLYTLTQRKYISLLTINIINDLMYMENLQNNISNPMLSKLSTNVKSNFPVTMLPWLQQNIQFSKNP